MKRKTFWRVVKMYHTRNNYLKEVRRFEHKEFAESLARSMCEARDEDTCPYWIAIQPVNISKAK